jgi:peptide/nickel transport system substrate-binding protein
MKRWLLIVTMLIAACSTPVPPTPEPTLAATRPPTLVPTIAALPTSTPAPTQVPAKILRGGISQEPDLLTPQFAKSPNSNRIAQLILVGLAEWNDKGELVPELAETIPSLENGGISKDGLTITWKLKKDLLWSDGSALTSRDVKFTWQAIMDERNAPTSRAGYDLIESIETPDNITVVIKFKSVYLDWMSLFTVGPNSGGAILPELSFKGKTALEKDPSIRSPRIASGPFRIDDWSTGRSLTLSANTNFYKGKPHLDKIEIRFFVDNAVALRALQAGEIDWYADFFETDIPEVAKATNVKLQVAPSTAYEHYFFNLGTVKGVNNKGKSDEDGFCPFQDVKVRRAILLGINRRAIVDKYFAGKTIIPASLWGNSMWTNTTLKAEDYNPDSAKKLLDDAGYKPVSQGAVRSGRCGGKEVKLSFKLEVTTKPMRQEIARLIQKDLVQIGVDVQPTFSNAQALYGAYSEASNLMMGKFDMAGLSYPEYLTPDWRCDSVPSKDNRNGSNFYHYCDPALDKLFADASTPDIATRKKGLMAIQKYLYDNALVIPLYARANVYAFGERFISAPFGAEEMFWNAEAWDVK